ncbi:hypothetical protein ACFU5Z_19465 [Streptomyces sp. NPDC057521]|uniref:hypothetical protein n=1 Tax=Streptomyces sp. NPDC057521 TaxID=3346156 RepID=UPI0036C749A8
MPEVHPSHSGLPALYITEVSGFRGRWKMSVVGPDRDVVAAADLGPVDTFVVAHPDDPGRYLIALDGEVPVLPREGAVQQLEKHGFVVAEEARDDTKTDHGWTQVATALWTAPCRPAA